MSARSIVHVEGIDVFYGKSQILFDVSLEVTEGQTLALLGRNGAGKSTTLKAIAGIARLKVPAERHQALTPAVQGIFDLLDGFDRVTLGETPPADAYGAKWDER